MTMDDTLLIAISHDHMYESLFKNQRYCLICRHLLPLDGNMLIHIRTHGEENKNKIKVDKLFQRYPAISRAAFMCNYCSKTFSTEERLKTHERLHGNGGKPYECFYCDRRFAVSKYLKQHEVTHAPGPNSNECPDCGVPFSLPSAFIDHRTKGTCKNENYGCCDTIFTRRIDFLKHQQDFHGGKKIKCHTCDSCGKNFSLPCALKAHIKIHKELPAGRKRRGPKEGAVRAKALSFTCRVCRQVFAERGELYKHSRTHGVGEKPFVCEICSKSYTQRTNYAQHLRTHTLEKPWHCNYCDKTFVSSQACQTHERVHTGEKPFQCPHCDRRFSRAWTLTSHISTHTGEKPYPCPECGKCFAQPSTQKAHTKTHFKGKLNPEEEEQQPKKKKKKKKKRKRPDTESSDEEESSSGDHFDLLYAAMGMKHR